MSDILNKRSQSSRDNEQSSDEEEDYRKMTQVKVRLLRTNWMFKGKEGQEQDDLIQFMQSINNLKDDEEAHYTNEFLLTIVDAFWSIY